MHCGATGQRFVPKLHLSESAGTRQTSAHPLPSRASSARESVSVWARLTGKRSARHPRTLNTALGVNWASEGEGVCQNIGDFRAQITAPLGPMPLSPGRGLNEDASRGAAAGRGRGMADTAVVEAARTAGAVRGSGGGGSDGGGGVAGIRGADGGGPGGGGGGGGVAQGEEPLGTAAVPGCADDTRTVEGVDTAVVLVAAGRLREGEIDTAGGCGVAATSANERAGQGEVDPPDAGTGSGTVLARRAAAARRRSRASRRAPSCRRREGKREKRHVMSWSLSG